LIRRGQRRSGAASFKDLKGVSKNNSSRIGLQTIE
jgi:hypothetical protein